VKAQIVSFHCVLRNKIGNVISSTFNQDVITHIHGQGEFMKGLAEGLEGLKKGEKRQIFLTAPEAYGFYDPGLVITVSRNGLPQGHSLEVGHQILTQSDNNENQVFRVIQATLNSITLDGNHPLAGQDLIFDIEGIESREATSEEVAESSFKFKNQIFH